MVIRWTRLLQPEWSDLDRSWRLRSAGKMGVRTLKVGKGWSREPPLQRDDPSPSRFLTVDNAGLVIYRARMAWVSQKILYVHLPLHAHRPTPARLVSRLPIVMSAAISLSSFLSRRLVPEPCMRLHRGGEKRRMQGERGRTRRLAAARLFGSPTAAITIKRSTVCGSESRRTIALFCKPRLSLNPCALF